jgi:hypothetical protein
MRKMLERITVDTAGIKLNYFTLNISDKEVKKDFMAHKIAV